MTVYRTTRLVLKNQRGEIAVDVGPGGGKDTLVLEVEHYATGHDAVEIQLQVGFDELVQWVDAIREAAKPLEKP